jgi:hypothetical protein
MALAFVIHRFLEETVVLRNICEHLQPQQRSLSALASSCGAFKNPALDALWFMQTSLAPLVKCLPADAWGEQICMADQHYDDEIRGIRRLVRSSCYSPSLFKTDLLASILGEHRHRMNGLGS